MLKRGLVLLYFLSNTFSDSSGTIPYKRRLSLTQSEAILDMVIKRCNLEMKNIIFYNGNSSDLTTVLLRKPPSVGLRSLFLLSMPKMRNLGVLTGINGYVVVFNSAEEWSNLLNTFLRYSCSENCTVIFLSKAPNSCRFAKPTLLLLGYEHFYTVYFVCTTEKYGPIVYTQNRYENTQPAGWYELDWMAGNSLYPWTFYYRYYSKDFCGNFNFNRTTPKKDIRIMAAWNRVITNKNEMKRDFIHYGNFYHILGGILSRRLNYLEKLLKIRFVYYVKKTVVTVDQTHDDSDFIFRSETSSDMIIKNHMLSPNDTFAFLHPTVYTTNIILSHIPRLATPLEKIGHFYGYWTLSSLIIISIIIFVVIYLKTNRDVASAAFDVLRLLINSGVETPINTLSLKIFFCMVFLYFMVIHATFSGNLPKFLTIPDFYGSIDTIEDLANPRITTIYTCDFKHDDIEKNDVIKEKIKPMCIPEIAIDRCIKNENSACIYGESTVKNDLINKKSVSKYYMSKNNFGSRISASVVRVRFFLREKFHWATTYLFDVHLDYGFDTQVKMAMEEITKNKALSHIDYRPITINDLKFAFILLIIGNSLGLICFFIELVIAKKYYQRISFRCLTRLMTFKPKKTHCKVQKIVVKPKELGPKLRTTKKCKSVRNSIESLSDLN